MATVQIDRGHIPALLQNASITYKNGDFKIDQAIRMVHVEKASDNILAQDKSNIYTARSTQRGTDGRSNYVNFGSHAVSFKTKNHALHTYVSDKIIKNRDVPYDPMVQATNGLTEAILLDKELEGITFLSTAGNYAYTGAIAAAWADPTSSNPVQDIMDAKGSMLVKPNVFCIGELDYLTISQNPHFQKFIGSGDSKDPAIVREESMAVILGVKKVIVFPAQYRTNPNEPEASATWQSVFSNFACMLYVEGIDDEEFEPTVDMTTFAWTASWDPDQEQRPTRVNSSYNTELDGGSQFIEVEGDFDFVSAIPEAGYLFTGITS